MFELLKGHLYLEVSAITKIDLVDYILDSQNRFYEGMAGLAINPVQVFST